LKEKQFKASRVELNYLEGPDNGPPVLLVHGHGLRWQSWEDVLPEFTKRWHVYAPDLRGHGASGRKDDGAYAHDDYVADLVEFINRVIGGPTYVVGHSMGGLIASGVAADPDADVVALVLEDSPFFLLAFGVPDALKQSFEGTRSVIQSSNTPEQIADGLVKYSLNTDPHAAIVRGEELFRVDPAIFTAVLESDAIPINEEAEFLASIQVPTLFMISDPEAGGILGYPGGTAASEIIPSCEVVNISGVGHYVHRERPAEFVKMVEDFFASVGSKAGV
jgi:pimeloyl-ACP methyl ester carboxylesterase